MMDSTRSAFGMPGTDRHADHILWAIDRICKPTPAMEWLARVGPIASKLNEEARNDQPRDGSEPNKTLPSNL